MASANQSYAQSLYNSQKAQKALSRGGGGSSSAAREGLAGKGGMILFVLGATALDILLGLALNNLPQISIPFEYKMPIACLVLCWYIITEVGSLFENAEKLGAKYPPFMKRIIEGMKSVVLKLSGHDEKDGE